MELARRALARLESQQQDPAHRQPRPDWSHAGFVRLHTRSIRRSNPPRPCPARFRRPGRGASQRRSSTRRARRADRAAASIERQLGSLEIASASAALTLVPEYSGLAPWALGAGPELYDIARSGSGTAGSVVGQFSRGSPPSYTMSPVSGSWLEDADLLFWGLAPRTIRCRPFRALVRGGAGRLSVLGVGAPATDFALISNSVKDFLPRVRGREPPPYSGRLFILM